VGVGGPGCEGDDGGELQGSEEERREEGEAAAEKEMDEEGAKRTARCWFAERLRPEEEESCRRAGESKSSLLLRAREGRGVEMLASANERDSCLRTRAAGASARAAASLASTASVKLLSRVGVADEAAGDAEASDLVRRMLRLTGVAGEEVVGGAPWISRGGGYQSASALSQRIVSSTEETKAVASSSQLSLLTSGVGAAGGCCALDSGAGLRTALGGIFCVVKECSGQACTSSYDS